uniref:Uncharacterized protein n=1 Tax=Anopheles minimus TaxID=112268 RepID=A0A182VZ02_9DIPT
MEAIDEGPSSCIRTVATILLRSLAVPVEPVCDESERVDSGTDSVEADVVIPRVTMVACACDCDDCCCCCWVRTSAGGRLTTSTVPPGLI